MQHPLFLMHRVKEEGWSDDHDRVNTRMYLAATRCTVQLSVVEVRVRHFAAHLELTAVMAGAVGGVAGCAFADTKLPRMSMSGNTDRAGKDGNIASRVYVRSGNAGAVQQFRAGVTVDLAAGTLLDETVVAVSVPHLTREIWANHPVAWPSQIREVNLTSAFEDGEVGGGLLRDTRLLELPSLEVRTWLRLCVPFYRFPNSDASVVTLCTHVHATLE